jgi:hypothetical protein
MQVSEGEKKSVGSRGGRAKERRQLEDWEWETSWITDKPIVVSQVEF